MWLAVELLSMRVGTEPALARVSRLQADTRVSVRNRGANRMNALAHAGIGMWLAA